MLVEYYFPQSLSPARLDRYLAGGWFRSGPSLFRARLLCLGNELYEVTNIRVDLEGHHLSRSLRRIWNRADRDLVLKSGPIQISSDREALYVQHKHRFKGFIFDSLEEFLFSGDSQGLFATQEIAVYRKGKLVAVSYFDEGHNSIASLLGLYCRGMGRYSLGLLTMLAEMKYARERGCRYYYPGYILQGYPHFDYKMRLGNIQYYNWNGRWKYLRDLAEEPGLVEFLKEQINLAADLLNEVGIASQQVLYPFFALGYMGIVDEEFLRSPIYLKLSPPFERADTPEGVFEIIEYVAEDQVYQLTTVRRDTDYSDLLSIEFADDFLESGMPESALLIRLSSTIRHRDPLRIAKYLISRKTSYEPSS